MIWSPSSRGRGLKFFAKINRLTQSSSPSSRGRGLKYLPKTSITRYAWSPSSRGRGLKCQNIYYIYLLNYVALFTRAWIEMRGKTTNLILWGVALFTRAWIEIICLISVLLILMVALFTRAWIEIPFLKVISSKFKRRPLHEGVD